MSDELRAYLLDKLTPEERSRLEERMFADDEFFALILDAENDLADAYAAGKLSPGDAAAFTDKFAGATYDPTGVRNRLNVAKAFFARQQTARSGHRNPYRKIRLQQALALAAALLVVSLAGWLYKRKTTMPLPTAPISAQPSHRNVIAIFLTSTVTRERNDVRPITLPARTDELRVTVAVPAVTPDTAIHAELRTATGNLLWQGAPQSWNGAAPVFLIPANRVPSGAAELDAFAGADRRLAGVYPLRFERR